MCGASETRQEGTMKRKKICGLDYLEQRPEKYVADERLWHLRCAIVDITRMLRELAAAKPIPKRRKA